ncbi:NAD(P)/FAD-dependent oxidoreductase [Desulfoluna spongiiphila]|uniref:NAD(P)/FAD-dependent oxidoreductase n=1 Tax=Desulfoluna spongiiphila TaxID=419481 RepID=UPI0012541FDB|nr:FAD-dependent oxidoreductase [Desulfoluna spongiiphila]VVS91095.1 amine oxidase [Desulfoluna spongiiphila]
MKSPLKIAVIGAGVSGITTACLLQDHHEVTLYEKNGYIGGHTHTVVIDRGPDEGTPVDTGFIVMNNRTYPLFTRLLSRLGVPLVETDMSFSYTCRRTGLEYASTNLNTLFAQRENIFRPAFWRFLLGVRSLMQRMRMDLAEGRLAGITLGEYMTREGVKREVTDRFVLPMAAAIWSAPDAKMAAFPMETFARFYENHGLLTLTEHPQWSVVSGGSHSYVKAFLNGFSGRVVEGTPVTGIQRTEDGVLVKTEGGHPEPFDRVVVAAHADEALKMLEDPSREETRLLSPWRYSANRVVLHTDASLLPSQPRARASWNYIRDEATGDGEPITVTYFMNRLQHLKTRHTWCVTLNPAREIPAPSVHRELIYDHPLFTFESVATQEGLKGLNGKGHTYFCGSYFGYGFHEDAVRSAVDVAAALGGTL